MEDSEWYPECVKYYSTLDVKGKLVIDFGGDFGTSPMYFIKLGATKVISLSLDELYFRDPRIVHYVGIEHYDKMLDDISRTSVKTVSEWVIKCDAEGYEWGFTAATLNFAHDWIIALHYPILNPFLYEWIKQNGEFVGSPSDSTKDGDEFAIYKKRGVNDA